MLKPLKDASTNGIYLCITRVPNTERVIVGSAEAKLFEYDFAAEKLEPIPFGDGHSSYINGVAWTPFGIVSGGYDGKLIWCDGESRQAIRTIENAHDKWIRKVIAGPDGKLVVSIADDMQIKLWDAESGKLRHAFSDHQPITPHHYPSM